MIKTMIKGNHWGKSCSIYAHMHALSRTARSSLPGTLQNAWGGISRAAKRSSELSPVHPIKIILLLQNYLIELYLYAFGQLVTLVVLHVVTVCPFG